jgi:hypothetical protein
MERIPDTHPRTGQDILEKIKLSSLPGIRSWPVQPVTKKVTIPTVVSVAVAISKN